MLVSIVKLLIQMFIVILFSPLLTGLIRKLKAKVQHRIGSPILQPYYDIWKLLKKDMVASSTASWIYFVAPYIYFITSLVACLCLPVISQLTGFTAYTDILFIVYLLVAGRVFIALASLDTGSTFGGMGSSREMLISALIEPAFFIVLITVSIKAGSGSTNVSNIYSYLQNIDVQLTAVSPVNILLLGCMLLVLIAETSRIPVDDPSTHLELTMVHEAMTLEYSGRHLAFIQMGCYLKQFMFMTFIANILMPFGMNVSNVFVAICIFIIKILVITLVIAVIELSTVKFRLFSMPNIAAIAFILGILGFMSGFIFNI